MANLLLPHGQNPSFFEPDAPPRRRPDMNKDIIEISDDSEPPSPPRRNQKRPNLTFRNPPMPQLDQSSDEAAFHSADSGSSDSDISLPLILRKKGSSNGNKRLKLRHSPAHLITLNQHVARHHEQNFQIPPSFRHDFVEGPIGPARQPHSQSMDYVRPLAAPQVKLENSDNQFIEPVPAPYYYDTKFDIEMYRGPGYEAFPVVLGTIPGHREICDKWKGKGKVLHAGGTVQGTKSQTPPDEHEAHCILQILEVFPDAETDFLLQRLRDPGNLENFNDDEIGDDALPAKIISQILEMDEYPRVPISPSAEAGARKQVDETGSNVPYNKHQLKDSRYLREAVILLASHFAHVPTHYINKVLHESRSIFESHHHLQDMENEYYSKTDRPYLRFRQPRVNLEKKYARPACEHRDDDKYSQMVNELQAAKQHTAREARRLEKQKEKDEAEATNLAIHQASGSLVECQCCFDDEIPMNRSVGCESGEEIHFFCFGCVARLAETQVGSLKYEMLCMHSSGCQASLQSEGVGQAVPIKTMDRLALNQQQAEIAAAGIEGLEQCPYCDFKAICEPIEVDRVFNCQNPDCARASCRRCQEPAHVPKTCEEVKADRGLDARHLVEEARSDSVMRKCPKCNVKIIKELGCNKMLCTNCRCIMCYECKANISSGKEGGYEHFNKPGAKCKLYDEQGVDRHEKEADEAERDAIRKVRAKDADLDEKLLHVDTGPGQKKAKPNSPAPLANGGMVHAGADLVGMRRRLQDLQNMHQHMVERNRIMGIDVQRRQREQMQEMARRIARDRAAALNQVPPRLRAPLGGAMLYNRDHTALEANARQDLAAFAADGVLANNQADQAIHQWRMNVAQPNQPAYFYNAYNGPVVPPPPLAAPLNQDIGPVYFDDAPVHNRFEAPDPFDIFHPGHGQYFQQQPGQQNQPQQGQPQY